MSGPRVDAVGDADGRKTEALRVEARHELADQQAALLRFQESLRHQLGAVAGQLEVGLESMPAP